MAEQGMSKEPPSEPLPCNTIVYRAATDESWLIENKTAVDAAAFYRRNPKWDASGITVGETPYAYREFLRKPIHGVISIHVGRVRDIARAAELPEGSIDVAFDKRPHGNIIGVPYRDDNRKLAERLASLLASSAARVYELFDPPRL